MIHVCFTWGANTVCRPCNYLLPPSGIKIFVFGGLELIFAFLFFKIALFSKLVLDTFKVSSLPNLCGMNLRLTRFFPHRYVVVSSKKVWHLPFISFATVWPFSGWQNATSRADTVLVIVEGVRNMFFSLWTNTTGECPLWVSTILVAGSAIAAMPYRYNRNWSVL